MKVCFARSGIGQQGEATNVPTQHLAHCKHPLSSIYPLKRSNGNCYFLLNSLKCLCIAQPKQASFNMKSVELEFPNPFLLKDWKIMILPLKSSSKFCIYHWKLVVFVRDIYVVMPLQEIRRGVLNIMGCGEREFYRLNGKFPKLRCCLIFSRLNPKTI